MPTRDEWAERGHNSIGQGEMFMRKWLAMEMLALVVIATVQLADDVDRRLKTAGL